MHDLHTYINTYIFIDSIDNQTKGRFKNATRETRSTKTKIN